MSLALVDFADRLVSISDLSRGKAGKVFADVEENNNDYIILKNNQPTAVLVSMKKYKETQQKIAVDELYLGLKKLHQKSVRQSGK